MHETIHIVQNGTQEPHGRISYINYKHTYGYSPLTTVEETFLYGPAWTNYIADADQYGGS